MRIAIAMLAALVITAVASEKPIPEHPLLRCERPVPGIPPPPPAIDPARLAEARRTAPPFADLAALGRHADHSGIRLTALARDGAGRRLGLAPGDLVTRIGDTATLHGRLFRAAVTAGPTRIVGLHADGTPFDIAHAGGLLGAPLWPDCDLRVLAGGLDPGGHGNAIAAAVSLVAAQPDLAHALLSDAFASGLERSGPANLLAALVAERAGAIDAALVHALAALQAGEAGMGTRRTAYRLAVCSGRFALAERLVTGSAGLLPDMVLPSLRRMRELAEQHRPAVSARPAPGHRETLIGRWYSRFGGGNAAPFALRQFELGNRTLTSKQDRPGSETGYTFGPLEGEGRLLLRVACESQPGDHSYCLLGIKPDDATWIDPANPRRPLPCFSLEIRPEGGCAIKGTMLPDSGQCSHELMHRPLTRPSAAPGKRHPPVEIELDVRKEAIGVRIDGRDIAVHPRPDPGGKAWFDIALHNLSLHIERLALDDYLPADPGDAWRRRKEAEWNAVAWYRYGADVAMNPALADPAEARVVATALQPVQDADSTIRSYLGLCLVRAGDHLAGVRAIEASIADPALIPDSRDFIRSALPGLREGRLPQRDSDAALLPLRSETRTEAGDRVEFHGATVQGKRTGRFRRIAADGSLKATWCVRQDEPFGYVRRFWPDGKLREEGRTGAGDFGPWVLYHPDGTRRASGDLAGMHLKGRFRTGEWTFLHPGGARQAVGSYLYHRPHGPWTWWHADGRKAQEGSFHLGEPVGAWTSWDATGTPTTGSGPGPGLAPADLDPKTDPAADASSGTPDAPPPKGAGKDDF